MQQLIKSVSEMVAVSWVLLAGQTLFFISYFGVAKRVENQNRGCAHKLGTQQIAVRKSE